MQQNQQQEIEKKAKDICYQGDERVLQKQVELKVNSSEDIIVKNVKLFSNLKEYNQDQRSIFLNIRKLPRFEKLTNKNVFGNQDFTVINQINNKNDNLPKQEVAIKMGNIVIKYQAHECPFKLKLEYINREKLQLQTFFIQDYETKLGEKFQIIQFEDLIPMHLDDLDDLEHSVNKQYLHGNLLNIKYLGLRKVCNVVRNGVIKMAFGEPVDLIYLQEYLGYSVLAGHSEGHSMFVLSLLNCIEKPNQNEIINFLKNEKNINSIVNFVNNEDKLNKCHFSKHIVKKNGKDFYLYNDFAVILSTMGVRGIDKNKIDQVNCSYTHDQRLALAKIIYKINGLNLSIQSNNKQIKDTQQIMQKNTINSEGFDKITQAMDNLMSFDSKAK